MSDIRMTKKNRAGHIYFEILILTDRNEIHEGSVRVVWKYSLVEYTGTWFYPTTVSSNFLSA
jgi:hypothetical protein